MNLSQELARRVERLARRFPAGDVAVLVGLLVLVANPTGECDPDEYVALTAGISSVLGAHLSAERIEALVEEAMDGLLEEGPDLRALAVGHRLVEQGRAEEGLRVGIAVAFASGRYGEAVHDRLETVARAAGITGARLEVLVREVREGLALDG